METIIDGSERQTIVKLLVEEEEERQDDDGITANSHGTNVGQESHRDYQQYAEECLRWADEVDSEQHRELFLSMARAWTQANLILKGVMVPKVEDESASLPELDDDF